MDLQRIITMMAEKQKEDDQVERLRAVFFFWSTSPRSVETAVRTTNLRTVVDT